VGFSATPGSKTPKPIVTKLGVRNYRRHSKRDFEGLNSRKPIKDTLSGTKSVKQGLGWGI